MTTSTIEVYTEGTYSVTVTNDLDCSVVEEVGVLVNAIESPIIEGEIMICKDEKTVLTVLGDYESYLWSDGSTTSSIEAEQGTYSVTIEDSYGCSGIANLNVEKLSPAISEMDVVICEEESYFAEGTLQTDSGIYYDTVSVENCLEIVKTNLFVEECRTIEEPKILVPNAFSPNHDGVNDVFGVNANFEPFDFELKIFSRWGELLYHTPNIEDSWDGTYLGQESEIGVYVWYVVYSYEDENNVLKTKMERGNITLIR